MFLRHKEIISETIITEVVRILSEAVKPLLKDNKCTLKLTDEIVVKGDRNYVESIATLTDIESGEHESTKGEAREEETKKGMDAITDYWCK